MKRILITIGAALLIGCAVGIYLRSQKALFRVNDEGVKLMLFKGGYRSYGLRFCDGHTFDGTSWTPVILSERGITYGHYWVPRLEHLNLKGFDENKKQTNSP